QFDGDLLRRYDVTGPRYTSYPTAPHFNAEFDADAYRLHVWESNGDPIPAPLSIYVHIPFCATVCFYCACTKVVTANRRRATPYLRDLFLEIEMQAGLFDTDRVVEQLHLGGGTPTFFDDDQLRRLMERIRGHFRLVPDAEGEFGIELDPRTLGSDTMRVLRQLGFNRVSLGVQDLDEDVQRAVNRIQPEEMTLAAVEASREEGFHSISMDLIYGLPRQTPESFGRSLESVIAMGPDRLSVFNYAHLPGRFKSQRQIAESELPDAGAKLRMLEETIARLIAAGYEYIGMDHFALPEDPLCVARRNGTLQRNFQGYSTRDHCDLIGIGMSSIGRVGDCYAQNARTLTRYAELLEHGQLPVERGIALSADDRLRRRVIMTLMCYFSLRPSEIEREWDVTFWEYFAPERRRLETFAADGLVRVEDDLIEVLPRGRLLIRNICMAFDRRLAESAGGEAGFSRVV
ncbi:MAG: oxygen-independent coproporphyrinogen III oxidase, partial [Gammaproteobacteria bacterium]|nr:oxygen-independent coproporphyrinogen III oxidase [Gammaproteobacteria bacterium]